jgi:hypothetical protein
MKIVSNAMPMYEATETEEVHAESAEEKLILRRSMDQVMVEMTLGPGPRTQREVWEETSDPRLAKGKSGK